MRFKQFIAFVLILAFAASSFSSLFSVADYYTNTASYAKNCVNKYRPKLNCNGKCQLMLKLKKQQEQDQRDPDRKAEQKLNVLSSKSFYSSFAGIEVYIHTNYSFPTSDGMLKNFSNAVFHPPTA